MGLYHTGVEVYGREYYFASVCTSRSSSSPWRLGRPVTQWVPGKGTPGPRAPCQGPAKAPRPRASRPKHARAMGGLPFRSPEWSGPRSRQGPQGRPRQAKGLPPKGLPDQGRCSAAQPKGLRAKGAVPSVPSMKNVFLILEFTPEAPGKPRKPPRGAKSKASKARRGAPRKCYWFTIENDGFRHPCPQ